MSEPGRLFFGGEIYTVDDARPMAEAAATRDGKIIAVGTEEECRSALGRDYEEVDLKGRALLPGFIDTHLHPTGIVTYEMFGDFRGVTTMKGLTEKLREIAREIPASEWVVGLQFEDQDLREPRLPTRHDLDLACPDRPAIIVKADGHMVIANSRAIEATGVSAKTPDPEGGRIDREKGGYPAGPFREAAVQFPLEAMPMPGMERITGAAGECFQRMVRHGITSAGVILQTDEEGVFGKQGALDVMFMQLLLDLIPFNLYIILVAHDLGPIEAARQTRLHQPEPGAGHRIGGMKFWADGTFSSCTAYMSEPYADQPDQKGFLIHSQEEMYRRMVMAHNAGLQIVIHVIGDAAVRTCVDLYDRLLAEHPRQDHRHRLEHVSLLNADLVSDISRLGLAVSVSPLFIRNEKDWLQKRLGAKRTAWTYAFRSLLEAGVRVAGASDAPVSSTEALNAIHCAITRDGFQPKQCLSAAEAIRMFTIDAAYAQFEESVKGSISAGKRADLVVLSRNPARVAPEEIKGIRVERTIVGGKTVYQA